MIRFTLILLFYFLTTVSGDELWHPFSQAEMIIKSDVIVIVEIQEAKGKFATAKVEKVIFSGKVKTPQKISIVPGSENTGCRPAHVFKNKKGDRLLLFLRVNKKNFSLCNDSFGALMIDDEKVLWLKKEKMNQTLEWFKGRTYTAISEVLKKIKDKKNP